jgi:hypothetical protein
MDILRRGVGVFLRLVKTASEAKPNTANGAQAGD